MRTRILPTLVVALGLLLSAFGYAFYQSHHLRVAEVRNTTAQRTGDLVRSELDNYVALMSAALESITRDPTLATAMRSRDTGALLARATPLFERLRSQFHVEHFYFHAPDRRNVLRVHDPNEKGDLINRFTLIEAQRTGAPGAGIEQGPTGNCTLRVVYPWRDAGGELLGYLELGTEFETVAQRVHDLLHVDLIALVDKRLLDRKKWENRNQRLGRQTAWPEYPDFVVIDRTVKEIPAPLRRFLSAGLPALGQTTIDSDAGGVAQVVFLPLADVSGHTLGELVVLRDITEITSQVRQSFVFVAIAFGLVGGFLVLFFYVFLGKIERDLNDRTARLAEANATLERRVAERTADLEAAHRKLVETARLAGMAEVAIGVLHNVGNVLNSVNTSAGVIAGTLRRSELRSLGQACELIRSNRATLGNYLSSDERGKLLPDFLLDVAKCLNAEQQQVLQELESLAGGIDHIKQIVSDQQSVAKGGNLVESVVPNELVEIAVGLQRGSFERHRIQMTRRLADVPAAPLDKHKVLQILVNLIGNAKQAVVESGRDERSITLALASVRDGDRTWLRFQVIDNGIGIAPENLTRIFAHGFTTRESGHGFGLHGAANLAAEMGGSLTAASDGLGRGSTFTLDLPLPTVATAATHGVAGPARATEAART